MKFINNVSKPIIFYIYIYFVCSLIIITSGTIINIINPVYTPLLVIIGIPLIPNLIMIKNFKYIYIFTVVSILIQLVVYFSGYIALQSYFIRIIVILAFLNYCRIKNVDFFKITRQILTILVLTTSIFYVLVEIMQLNIPYSIVKDENLLSYRNYFNVYYSLNFSPITLYGIVFGRITSIFWEPGLYAVFLNFIIIQILFLEKKFSKLNLIVVLISSAQILITASITGVIFLTFSILMKSYSREKKLNFFVYFMQNIVSTVFIFLFMINFYYLFIEKINAEVTSYFTRLNDLINPIKLFIEKPLFGWGFANDKVYLSRFDRITSNSISSIIYQTGLYGVIVYLMIIKSSFNHIKRKYNNLTSLILISFILIFSMSQPIFTHNFMLMLIFVGVPFHNSNIKYNKNKFNS